MAHSHLVLDGVNKEKKFFMKQKGKPFIIDSLFKDYKNLKACATVISDLTMIMYNIIL